MNVKIGEKIKALRKRDDITQERLAEILGVTNQAVSKWEGGNSYPDIEYISPIANLFNVPIDYLFDHDIAKKRKIIEAYCSKFDSYKQAKHSLYDERIELMRHALAEFPAEEKLLIKLAGTLFEKWLSNGLRHLHADGYTYPDYKWHKSLDSWEESMKIMEELLASSTDDVIRAKCRINLAMIYGRTDQKEKLRAMVEKFDSIFNSKENILHFTLFGEEGIKNDQKYLVSILYLLGNAFFLLPGDEYGSLTVEARNILIDLWKLVFRGDDAIYCNQIGDLYYSNALYLRSDPDAAVKALEQSFAYVKIYDELDIGEGEKTYTSPFVNRLTYNREEFGQRDEVQKLLKYMTTDGYFNELYENASFNALLKEVEAWVSERNLTHN